MNNLEPSIYYFTSNFCKITIYLPECTMCYSCAVFKDTTRSLTDIHKYLLENRFLNNFFVMWYISVLYTKCAKVLIHPSFLCVLPGKQETQAVISWNVCKRESKKQSLFSSSKQPSSTQSEPTWRSFLVLQASRRTSQSSSLDVGCLLFHCLSTWSHAAYVEVWALGRGFIPP